MLNKRDPFGFLDPQYETRRAAQFAIELEKEGYPPGASLWPAWKRTKWAWENQRTSTGVTPWGQPFDVQSGPYLEPPKQQKQPADPIPLERGLQFIRDVDGSRRACLWITPWGELRASNTFALMPPVLEPP